MRYYNTNGDVLNACKQCETEEDAAEVVRKLAEQESTTEESVKSGLGYLLGYLDSDERHRLYPLFKGCNHPFFGESFGREGV